MRKNGYDYCNLREKTDEKGEKISFLTSEGII
jgi:hypothetical protein